MKTQVSWLAQLCKGDYSYKPTNRLLQQIKYITNANGAHHQQLPNKDGKSS